MQEPLGKPFPQDAHMERALLGAILAEHQNAGEILDSMKPEDFFDRRHQRIARKMLELYGDGNRVNLVSIYDEFTKLGESESEAVGGLAYISSMTDGVLTIGDILFILRGLRRMATFRHIVNITDSLQQLAFEQAGGAESLIDSAIERF